MKPYLQERQKTDRTSSILGAAMAVAIPVCAAVFCSFSGMRYLYPPPEENTFVLDFTEEIEVEQNFRGSQPQAEEVDLTKPIELVQKAESPYVSKKENLTPATKNDAHGDVDVPATKEEPELDPRAAFPGMSKKDTSLTAPHSAREGSATFKAGHPEGNTDSGKTTGKPNAHLKGRNVVGNLPHPAGSTQKEGVVVVSIWVDQYGTVTKAQAGVEGTTVTDTDLWNAARNAAMKAHFNMAPEAPALQQGTITYIFKLK